MYFGAKWDLVFGDFVQLSIMKEKSVIGGVEKKPTRLPSISLV